MPTSRFTSEQLRMIQQEAYREGFQDGVKSMVPKREQFRITDIAKQAKPKRKMSAWNKFVKANSNKKIYKFANGKLKLKKMGIAFRKTRAGKKR